MAEFTALWDVLKNSANTLLESALEAATEAFQKTGRIRGQLDDLISAYESESLVLVLGAGVSMSYGPTRLEHASAKLTIKCHGRF